jgi:hypothetical protein
MRGDLQEGGFDLRIHHRDGRTLYVRNPEKNYAFEKVGEIAYWYTWGKAIWIDGVLYTLTQEKEMKK